MRQNLQLENFSIQYSSASAPLFPGLTACFSPGWTGISGANGCGKTSLLRLICKDSSLPENISQGTLDGPVFRYYCPQRTDFLPVKADDFISALYEQDNRAGKLSGILGIDHGWYYRWDSLSFGERKRFQLAVALWLDPEILAVDEPTNHLDSVARELVRSGLCEYKGIGLIVSHDRALLDQITFQTLFLSGENSSIRPGGVSKGLEEIEKEALAAQRDYQNTKAQLKALKAEEHKRRELAAGQQKRRSKRGLAIKDHDARFKLNLARMSGKDGTGGKLLRQMQGRISQSEQKLASISVQKKTTTGITLHSKKAGSDFLMRMEADRIHLGEKLFLDIPDLEISPGERISLTGDNGTGKTSLVKKILLNLSVPEATVLYLPQELDENEYDNLRKKLDRLPSSEKGEIIGCVARLGSDPHRVLDSRLFSPGEARKLLMAFAMSRDTRLIILDEPTNHLDLPSITALENALILLDCAMLVISHDKRFREALCGREWRIIRKQETHRLLII